MKVSRNSPATAAVGLLNCYTFSRVGSPPFVRKDIGVLTLGTYLVSEAFFNCRLVIQHPICVSCSNLGLFFFFLIIIHRSEMLCFTYLLAYYLYCAILHTKSFLELDLRVVE